MKIIYSSKVKKYFEDYNKMKRKISPDWVRIIKKHIDRLKAAECFGDFLKLGLGHPEQLKGYKETIYSLRITKNVRLILELSDANDTVYICDEAEIKGVCDYHGSKENWFIP